MQKLFNIASLGLLWLAIINFGGADPEVVSSPAMPSNNLPFELACQDTIIVTLDPNCQFELRLDIGLAGDLPTCLESSDLQILVEDPNPANGAIVDQCGFWRYYIGLILPNDCTSFSSCWGLIQAEDKTAPEIRVPDEKRYLLSCLEIDTILNNPESLELTGFAETRDNCDLQWKTLKNFNDQLVEQDPCKDWQIRRTFFTEDEKGNKAQAVQIINLTRPSLDIITINEIFQLDTICGYAETLAKDATGNIHPSVTGYPYFLNEFGEKINLTEGVCGLATNYKDRRYDFCEAAYKIERLWTVSDWCSGQKKEFRQLIKIGDLQGPKISFSRDTIHTSTGPFACEGTIEVLRPQVEDICSEPSIQVALHQITVDFRGGKDTNQVQTLALGAERTFFKPTPAGNYFLVYTVIDQCKNSSQDTLLAKITDKVKPVAKCTDQLNVTLNNYGYAQVETRDINEGSTDNCAIDSLQVRRLLLVDEDCVALDSIQYSEWQDLVFFNCCDLNQKIEVALRVVDKSGNESQCWTNVLIEDKEIPFCSAPEDVVIDCDSFPQGFNYSDPIQLQATFGFAVGIDACSPITIEEVNLQNDLQKCGYGTIIRSFIAYDEFGRVSTNVCEQTITVLPVHNYEIKFPLDYTTVCAEPEPDSLLLTSYGCDLLAVFSDDTKLTAAGEECYKIFRKYQVINWCEYDGIANPFIVPRDVDCDGKPGDEDIYVLVRPDNKVYFDANNNELDSFPVRDTIDAYNCFGLEEFGNPYGYWIGTDSVPGLVSRGFWEYTQIIKVQDTIAPTIFVEDSIYYCINLADCAAEVVVSFAIIDECVDGNVRITTYIEEEGPVNEYREYSEDPWNLVGRYPKYLMSGTVPEGNYRIEIEADDQCGNATKVAYFLEVVDCKPPALLCREGIVVELSRQEQGSDADGDGDADKGANIIWATDFLASIQEDDCSGPVDYSINRSGELPDRDRKSLIVTCDDPEILDVEIYAWDNANNPYSIQPNGQEGGANFDFCKTFIEVQDNQNLCAPAGGIDVAGTIKNHSGQAMLGIEVRLSGASSSQVNTNTNGEFYISGLAEGYDYSIFPQKTTDLLQGVSTLDIIYISKHILGIKPFNSPLQLLASDINRSGSVSTLDIILLRKAILNVDTKAINLAGWRFIDAKHQFTNPANPWAQPIPEVISLNNIAYSQGDLDFLALKMGDVSGLLTARSQTAPTVYLELDDRLLEPGTQVRIPVYLESVEKLEGLQFDLKVNPTVASLLKVESEVISDNQIHRLAPNQLLISWDAYHSFKKQEHFEKKPLLFLDLKIHQKAALSEVLGLERRILIPEVYLNNKTGALDLKWAQAQLEDFSAKVYPNPFKEELNVQLGTGWDPQQVLDVQLLNLKGQLILQKRFDAQDWRAYPLSLPIAQDLIPGIYLLQVKQSHKKMNFKVLR